MEFAIVVPIMLALVAAIVEFGVAFKVYNGVDRLANQYALAWADCSDYPAGTCLTELQTYVSTTTMSNIAPQLKPPNLTISIFEVKMSNATPSVIYSYPSAATPNAAQTSAASAALPSGQTGVIVTVSYQHSLQFFSTLMGDLLNPYLSPTYTIVQLKS